TSPRNSPHPYSIPPFSSSFFFYCSGPHRDLHSFPTRRSSDLARRTPRARRARRRSAPRRDSPPAAADATAADRRLTRPGRASRRSEEHTSELQSQSNLVCRLLLEKKKKKKKKQHKQKNKIKQK